MAGTLQMCCRVRARNMNGFAQKNMFGWKVAILELTQTDQKMLVAHIAKV